MNALRMLSMVAALILCSFVVSSPARSGPPRSVNGIWRYTPYIVEVEQAGCNSFLTTFETAIWTGDFVGTSTEDGKVVIHCSGLWSFNAIVNLEVSVEDESGVWRSGALVLSVNGSRPDDSSDWQGQWVIISGTRELVSLRGQGVFWGPGAPAPATQGDVYYDGNVHFDGRRGH